MLVTKRRSMYNARVSIVDRGQEAGCDFITGFVQRFINQAINSALDIISGMDEWDDDGQDQRRTIMSTRSLSYFGTEWPTCGRFNVRSGEKCIQREMTVWSELPAMKDWMFHVVFVGLEGEGTADVYTYQVIWSVPTPSHPEPLVTVSVFFCILVSRIQPPYYPVEVSYVFEAHRFVHTLDMKFQPKSLYDIYDMKKMMFRTFKF